MIVLLHGVFVAGGKSLVLSRKQTNSLLQLHLALKMSFVFGVYLLSQHVEVHTHKVRQLLQRANLLCVDHLLGAQHLLKLASHI